MNGFYGSMGMKDYPKTMYINRNLVIPEQNGDQFDIEWYSKNHV